MYQCSKKLVTCKEHCCFDNSEFPANLIFTSDVCWGSLGTSIFANSSSAASNTQSRPPSRLSFRFLWLWNHQQTTTNDNNPPALGQKPPGNDHKPPKTVINEQINLSQILIIHFFSKLEPRQSLADVNKHQCLTLLCNLIIHTLCNSWHISHDLFLFNQRLPWLRATVV